MKTVTRVFAFLIIIFLPTSGFAGDDPSIPTSEKRKIKTAMVNYIKGNSTVNGNFLIYDGEIGRTRHTKFDHVHKGVMKKDDGFLACVDLLDGKTLLDVDFVVTKEGGEYKVSKVAIHKVEGKKRKGHLDQ